MHRKATPSRNESEESKVQDQLNGDDTMNEGKVAQPFDLLREEFMSMKFPQKLAYSSISNKMETSKDVLSLTSINYKGTIKVAEYCRKSAEQVTVKADDPLAAFPEISRSHAEVLKATNLPHKNKVRRGLVNWERGAYSNDQPCILDDIPNVIDLNMWISDSDLMHVARSESSMARQCGSKVFSTRQNILEDKIDDLIKTSSTDKEALPPTGCVCQIISLIGIGKCESDKCEKVHSDLLSKFSTASRIQAAYVRTLNYFRNPNTENIKSCFNLYLYERENAELNREFSAGCLTEFIGQEKGCRVLVDIVYFGLTGYLSGNHNPEDGFAELVRCLLSDSLLLTLLAYATTPLIESYHILSNDNVDVSRMLLRVLAENLDKPARTFHEMHLIRLGLLTLCSVSALTLESKDSTSLELIASVYDGITRRCRDDLPKVCEPKSDIRQLLVIPYTSLLMFSLFAHSWTLSNKDAYHTSFIYGEDVYKPDITNQHDKLAAMFDLVLTVTTCASSRKSDATCERLNAIAESLTSKFGAVYDYIHSKALAMNEYDDRALEKMLDQEVCDWPEVLHALQLPDHTMANDEMDDIVDSLLSEFEKLM